MYKTDIKINATQKRMVQRIALYADVGKVRQQVVLDAMLRIPRDHFVDAVWRYQAFEEKTLPMGRSYLTISLPSEVCRMTSWLYAHCRHECILEIGTGSGYQSAILAQLWQQVYTIERVAWLLPKARQRHCDLGITNVYYAVADGEQGWQQPLLFDAIMVTAAVQKIPMQLLQQLRIGGYLLAPIGDSQQQFLTLLQRQGEQRFSQKDIALTQFVPLLQGIEE